MENNPVVTAFFDEATNTVSYVVADPETDKCAIVDSLLDYDAASGRTSSESADKLIGHVMEHKLSVEWIIDSHVHADHLTAAPYIRSKIGGKTAIGKQIAEVQKVFGALFNAEQAFHTDGSQFDHLFTDGEIYKIGSLEGRAIHTPGHTPACMSHVIGDAVFVGDTLFMPDYGTARCDFPGGNAGVLYDSIQKLFALDDATRVFLCHDYKAAGRNDYQWETTIAEQRRQNVHLSSMTTREEFVEMRNKRDATLNMPKLLLPSVQVNMRAGELPPAEDNGKHYIKIPVDAI